MVVTYLTVYIITKCSVFYYKIIREHCRIKTNVDSTAFIANSIKYAILEYMNQCMKYVVLEICDRLLYQELIATVVINEWLDGMGFNATF